MDARTATAALLLVLAGLIVAVLVLRAATARTGRRGDVVLGPDTVVRCAQGHVFMTAWVPLVSVKALRLGPVRIQPCPLCGRPVPVTPVPESELTPALVEEARRHRDGLPP